MILIKKDGMTQGKNFFQKTLKVDELEVISIALCLTLVVLLYTFVEDVEESLEVLYMI